MHPFQGKVYDIWYDTTNELLQIRGVTIKEYNEEGRSASTIVIKGINIEEFKKEGRTAWSLVIECAGKLKDTDERTTFWIACGNPNVQYETIAQKLTDHRRSLPPDRKGDMRIKETATAAIVDVLLHRARRKIQECLDEKMELLKRRYGRKSRRP